MAKFSSKEIESQYNLIKMLLSDSKQYKKALKAMKEDIVYMSMEFKKMPEKESIIL